MTTILTLPEHEQNTVLYYLCKIDKDVTCNEKYYDWFLNRTSPTEVPWDHNYRGEISATDHEFFNNHKSVIQSLHSTLSFVNNNNPVYYLLQKINPTPKELKDLSLLACSTNRILNAILDYVHDHYYQHYYFGLFPVQLKTIEYFKKTFNITLTKSFKDIIFFSNFLTHNARQQSTQKNRRISRFDIYNFILIEIEESSDDVLPDVYKLNIEIDALIKNPLHQVQYSTAAQLYYLKQIATKLNFFDAIQIIPPNDIQEYERDTVIENIIDNLPTDLPVLPPPTIRYLHQLAIKFGLYDGADFIKTHI